jgi:glutathionylspermidine synthase
MTTPEFRAGEPLDGEAYDELVQRAVFDCCKWNLTAHDLATVCRFPIVLARHHFDQLARQAELVAEEALEAEAELLSRSDLHARLAIPKRMLRHFRHAATSSAPRLLRVDFHPTPDGYRITEANSDVAGGFIEGSGLSRLWSKLGVGQMAGDPAGALASVLKGKYGDGAVIGLLHLTRYLDDRQVVTYLGRRLEEGGLRVLPFDATQLRAGGNVQLGEEQTKVNAVFRFLPGEWLEQLPAETAWSELISSNAVCNPVTTMLTQSKRFPLVWGELNTPLPTWKALMPETVEPNDVSWPDPNYVMKPALGHEGFGVSIVGVSEQSEDAGIARQVRKVPTNWVAQRRFTFTPIGTPDGPRFVCVGVYVIDGRAAGAYARVSRTALINGDVQDAVVLLQAE